MTPGRGTARRARCAALTLVALLAAGCSGGGQGASDGSAGRGTGAATGAGATGTPGSTTPLGSGGGPGGTAGATSGPEAAAPTPTPTGAAGSIPADPGAIRATVAGTVTSGLRTPWGVTFLPDGSALVSERDTARIVRVPAGGGDATEVGTVPGVVHGGEGGLLGITVGPAYSSDRWLWAYLTASDGNRLVRMRYVPGEPLGEPQPLLTGIPAGPIHNGGRLAFGPDGMLYVTTGDGSERSHSQDRGSLAGKILRVTPDGQPAPGNPFAGSPVWTLGHRNVQGIAWDPKGRMWASEFGQDTWDELNLIEPGRDYGWPVVEGKAGRQGFTDPVVQWRPDDASPSGIAVADGSVWLAALRGSRLWQVPVVPAPGTPRFDFLYEHGRLRTVVPAPDGSLWLVTSNTDGRGDPKPGDDRILRLTLG